MGLCIEEAVVAGGTYFGVSGVTLHAFNLATGRNSGRRSRYVPSLMTASERFPHRASRGTDEPVAEIVPDTQPDGLFYQSAGRRVCHSVARS